MAQKKITLMSVLCLLSSVNVFAGRGSTEVSSTPVAPTPVAPTPVAPISSAPPPSNNDGQNSGMSAQQMAALGLVGGAGVVGTLGAGLIASNNKNKNKTLKRKIDLLEGEVDQENSIVKESDEEKEISKGLEGMISTANPYNIPNIDPTQVPPKHKEITRRRTFSAPLPITPVLAEVNGEQVALENDKVEKIEEEKVKDENPKAAPDYLEEAKQKIPEFGELIKLHDKHVQQLKTNSDISLENVQKKQSKYIALHEKFIEKANMFGSKSEIPKKISEHVRNMNNTYVQKKDEIVKRQFPEKAAKEQKTSGSHEIKVT